MDERVAEMMRVEAALKTEQSWFNDGDPLLVDTKAHIIGAITAGELEPVSFDSTYYRPTADFGRRVTAEELEQLPDGVGTSQFSVPFLRPVALKVLEAVTKEAHGIYSTTVRPLRGVDDIKYPITSMTRTRNYQDLLVRSGKLAFDSAETQTVSTHQYGMAIDFDHSGLYVLNEGSWRGVGVGRDEHLFDPEAIDILADTLEEYRRVGVISSICEIPNGRGCFHVAVNPEAAF